ncbi:unnamed protein product [Owenia fusiformis]|uniref:Uncharacterized protein n=1 Tax=Owenia fusiformis TaxID=6347 RepID=A0A8J1U8T2_OWEFU|nr:unnamed protein product [Owenia fusiformis]
MPLYNVSGAQYLGLLKFFNSYQRNNVLGKQELRAILSRRDIFPTDGELQQMIDSISVESSGISFQAFADYISEYPGLRDADKDFSAAFNIFDRSGTGELSREDLGFVIGKMGQKGTDVDAILEACDKNKDGKIQYDEFIEVMKKQI